MVQFSGILKYFLFVIHSCLQERMLGGETNKTQMMLMKVTTILISTDDDLMNFGLQLGFTYEMVIQKRSNHPRSVEGAAMALACHWWDRCTKTVDWRKRELSSSCTTLKKEHLRGKVDEVLKQYTDLSAAGKASLSPRKKPGYKPY